ncbi:MAG: hypothetical protein IPJ81_11230 [Chitinophagaceae bacterium]|nr:hypothetical protein [Chitinophagaceae bacterium]
MKKEEIQKRKSIFNKQVIMQFNQNILESLSGGKLPDEQENMRIANKLGLLIVIFLLFQFCVVVALVFKTFAV